MKLAAIVIACLWCLPLGFFAIRAAALHWRANRKPRMNCPGCGKPARFVRDRGFRDGSGFVFTCNSDSLCKYHGLYFYPDGFKWREAYRAKDRRAEHRIRREIERKLWASGRLIK